MLLMLEKGIRSGIYHAIHRYVKDNNQYMKDYDKNKESTYLSIGMQIIYMDGQWFTVNGFQ